jgi:hypothetical protein
MRGYLPQMPDPGDNRPATPMLPRQLHKPARGTRNAMPADHRPLVADYRPSGAYTGKTPYTRKKKG